MKRFLPLFLPAILLASPGETQDRIKGDLHAAKEGIKQAGKAVGHTFKEAGKAIGHGAREAGRGIKRAVKGKG